MTSRRWTKRLITAAYWIVAAAFMVGAVTKYLSGETFFGPSYLVKFTEWGYPSWFRFVVGTIEGIAAVLLVVPDRRTRFVGASALVFVLTGATTTHIVNHDPISESVSAPSWLLVNAVLALANWPTDWRDLLRPRQQAVNA